MKKYEPIEVRVSLYDYDSKRLHIFMEMLNDDMVCSAVYEDVNGNRYSHKPTGSIS